MSSCLRRRLRVGTLRARILLAMIVVGPVAFGTVQLVVASSERRFLVEQSGRELDGLARGTAGQIGIFLDALLANMRATAAQPEMAAGAGDERREALTRVYLADNRFSRLSLYDTAGNLIAGSHPGSPASIADRASFRQAAGGRQGWMWAVARSTGRPSLLIHTPVRDAERRVLAVLGSVVDVKSLSAALQSVPLGRGGHAFVVDTGGSIVLETSEDHGREALHSTRSLGHELAGPGTTVHSVRGVRHVAGHAPVPETSWTVFVERQERDVLAPASHLWRLAMATLLGTILLAMIASALLARRLSRPVTGLVRAADAIRAGDMTVPLPPVAGQSLEVQTLIDAFAAMRAEVADRERTLRHSEARYRSIFENAVQGIFHVDPDLRPVALNPALAEVLGYDDPEDLLGHIDRINDVAADVERDAALGDLLGRHDEVRDFEHALRRKDGGVVEASVSIRALRGEDGQLKGWEGMVTDVTERRRAHQALVAAYEREREAAADLARLNEMKDMFLMAVSHELRTPLTAVSGIAHALKKRGEAMSSDRRQELAARMANGAERLERLLASVLDVDRLRRGVIEPRRREVWLPDFVEKVVADVSVGRRVVDVAAEPVHAFIDPAQIERVIENLLVNAGRYTPADARVWVRGWTKGRDLILAVEDDGPGVPEDLRERIFRPFEQGEVVGHSPGTGIGLSLVAGFASLHGGEAWVTDRKGGGASFRVRLPACVVPGSAAAPPPPAEIALGA